MIVLPIPYYILKESGEIAPFESHIRRLNPNQLFGLAYSYPDREYKFFMTEMLKPDIIELGTSRSMMVERYIFSSSYSFYNAGGAVQNIDDYYEFIQNLDYNPKLVIIDINQFFFNANSLKTEPAVYKRKENRSSYNLIPRCLADLIMGKISLVGLQENENIGINARFAKNGFTESGTYYYGRVISNPTEAEDYNFKNTFNRIANHIIHFETSNEVDMNSVTSLKRFCDICKERNIKLLGFLPPFAPPVLQCMKDDGNYKYLEGIYSSISPFFDNKTMFVYDYTDVSSLTPTDYGFLDGFHCTSYVTNKIFKDILSRNQHLSNFFIPSDQIDSLNIEYIKHNKKLHSCLN